MALPLAASAVAAGRCGGTPRPWGGPGVAASGEGAGVCRAPLFMFSAFPMLLSSAPCLASTCEGFHPGQLRP